MKKITLLLMLFAISTLTIITNATAQKGFYISTQAAPQLGVMFNADDVKGAQTDYKLKGAGTFGIGAGYHFSRNMGIGTELMYAGLRQRYLYGDQEYTQRFTYLTIPLLFTFNSNPDALVMFTAKGGPQVGILLESSVADATDVTLNGDTKDKYQSVNAGAIVGAGGSLRLTSAMYFNMGLRIEGTFTNTEKTGYQNYVKGRAKTYLFSTGVEFGIKYFLYK
jgi:hypothetical protein